MVSTDPSSAGAGARLASAHPARASPVARFVGWVTQRSTLLGAALIGAAVAGVWWQMLDEDTAVTVILFASSLLISEESTLARRTVSFLAPAFVHQIGRHAVLHHLPSADADTLYKEK